MSYKILIILCVILFLSCSEISESSVEENGYTMLMPVVENDKDTVVNGSLYKTKVYLTNDSLYKVAVLNGIENYLTVKYEPYIDTTHFSRSTKTSIMMGDTALIEFTLDIPDSGGNKIIAHPWQVDINLNFKQDNKLIDTTFIYQSTIYVRRK